MPALALAVVLAGGLWPFGDSPRDAEPTVGSLPRRTPGIEASSTVAGSAALAREHYREFLALPGTPADMRAEAMRRLADLHLANAEEADAAGDAAVGAADYRQAVALYRQYLDEFPGRAGTDRVLYALSRAHDGVGEHEQSLAALDELVGRFPDSAMAPEAQFRRGERLFVMRDYAGAERAYAAVAARSGTTEFRDQSLYKLGWARFKLGQYEECLDPFLDVLDERLGELPGRYDQQLLNALSKPERELVEDTLRAMSLAVSQMQGMASLDDLLDRRGAIGYADVIYAGLGDLYLSQERYGDAADAYRGFVRREGAHPRAPYLQSQVIGAYAAGKFPSKVLDAKAEYVELYGLTSPYWQGVDPASRPEVVRDLKANLTDLASHDHERAQKTRAADAYLKAADWYRRFLEYFPGDPESAQRNFLLAEILYESGDFAAATGEYRRAAYDYGAHPQAAEAGYAALLAAREHEKRLPPAEQASWHAAGIEEQLKFAASFPDHAQAPVVETNAAEEIFRRGDPARAIEIAGSVVKRTPAVLPEQQRVAWTVLAHAQFDLGRFAEAERAYQQLRPLVGADPVAQGEIEERIAASVYKQAEAQKTSGDHAQAVAGYLRVADAAPQASIRPNAIFDAAALLVADRQWPQAVDVLQRFRREYPAHELNGEVTQQLAVALVESGRGSEAASEFETIAATEKLGADVQREALWRAAELYDAAGEREPAVRVYAAIVGRFPQPLTESLEARARLADLARDTGDTGARQRWLQDIVAADAGAGAERSDRSRYLAAQATLELAAPARDAFAAKRLTAPLPASLKSKKQAMELALAAYGKAADYGVAGVTTAATFETAELYYRLSRDLMASEKPAKLSAEELEEYQLLLEEQAFPFEEKAIELHALNAARTGDGVYDDWVKRSFGRLAELNPARWARSERSEREFVLAADDLDGAAQSLDREIASCLFCAARWNELGVVQRRRGEFADAEQSYLMALSADSGYPEGLFNLGVLYEIYLQRPELALAHYQRFRDLQPPDAVGDVSKWIMDLERRTGVVEQAARAEQVQ